MQAQSQLDRGAPAQAAETMKAYAADGSRPSLLLDAQIALVATPAVAPDNADPEGERVGAADLGRGASGDDSLAWSALGQTWGRLGVPLRSIRAEAESRYALGDLLGAVDRLRAGQRLARGGGPVDFIDALGARFAPARDRGAAKADRSPTSARRAERAAPSRARPRAAARRSGANPSHKPHARFAARAQATLRLAPHIGRRDEETHRGAGGRRPARRRPAPPAQSRSSP